MSFLVLVKSSNWAQGADGGLTLLNYHFFSEIFVTPGGSVASATLTRHDRPDAPVAYQDQGSNWYMEGGHFDSLDEVDGAYPNGMFTFEVTTPALVYRDSLELAGPGGATDIPAPITISFEQNGAPVDATALDPHADLTIRWSEYSNGRADPRGVVDDMIFVVVADCHGERLFHTGLPFQGEYMRYDAGEVRVRAESLRPGMPYSAFVEFPHVVDSRVSHGVPAFTSYATATYVDLHTSGEAEDEMCPVAPPPMDTGQTDRMDPAASDTMRLLQ